MTEAYDPRIEDEDLDALEAERIDQEDELEREPEYEDVTSETGIHDEPVLVQPLGHEHAVPVPSGTLVAREAGECAVAGCYRSPMEHGRGLCPAHWDNLRGHHG